MMQFDEKSRAGDEAPPAATAVPVTGETVEVVRPLGVTSGAAQPCESRPERVREVAKVAQRGDHEHAAAGRSRSHASV